MTTDLFNVQIEREVKALRAENKALRQENMELRLTASMLLTAARGSWHVQARVAKRRAINLLRAVA